MRVSLLKVAFVGGLGLTFALASAPGCSGTTGPGFFNPQGMDSGVVSVGTGCTGLMNCCALLTGANQTNCQTAVTNAAGSATTCASDLSMYQQAGFCVPTVGTNDGGNVLPGGSGTGSGPGTTTHTDGGIACPAGLQCDVACSGGKTTTISGKVYDPAGKDPLYDVAVYIPATPLVALPKGVPTGSDACSCGALFPSGALTNATTAVDGSFTLKNVPVGSNVPLVLQIGKWRRVVKVNVTACQDNPQMAKSLTLPGTVAAGDIENNMPDIAVSTGGADSLECLLVRMGVSSSEYVAGTSTAGHVHVFSGGDPSGGGGGGVGGPESTPMPGAPSSPTGLWSSQAQLMPYDVVLLSCEGGETYNANPPALEAYLNAGGRAFGSHFHYSWFGGPLGSGQGYAAPADWGSNLANWSVGSGGGFGGGATGGVIVTTLNGSTMPFPKGLTLSTWLDENGALGAPNISATELPIYQPRYNATVVASDKPSQPWITADSASGHGGATLYFSFDTPVNATGTPPSYCGRAVFSDLHVAGNTTACGGGGFGGSCDDSNKPPPSSCYTGDLSPQEKALEYMLFDLSSCVVPDTVAVPVDAGLPPPPPK